MLTFLSFLLILLVCLPSLANLAYAASPDLTVDDVWLEKASNPGEVVAQVAPGEEFLIVASVKNIGDAPASGYYLDVYYDSDYGRGDPDNIAVSEIQVWYVGPLTAQDGSHTTKWIIDPDNQIAEVNESNNEKDLIFTIGAPQTQSPTLTLTPTSGGVGTVVSVSGSNYQGTTCQLISSPPGLFSLQVCSIAAGVLTASFTVDSGAAAQTYTVTVQTDASDSAANTFAILQTYSIITVNTVKTDGSALSGVQVTLGSESKTTDSSGKAEFSVSAGTYGLSVQSSVSGGSGVQYVFAQWSDGDTANTKSITVSASTTYDVRYKTQYQLTMQANPSGSGTVSPSVGTYWYDSGSLVTISATANSGYVFSSWSGSGSGSYTGTTNPASITMNGPVSETATLAKVSGAMISAVTLTPNPAVQGSAVVFAVDVQNIASTTMSSHKVQVTIYGPDGNLVGSGSGTISRLAARAKSTVKITYTLPQSASAGLWTYSVSLYQGTTLLDQKTGGSFTVNQAVIAGSIISVSDSPDPVARSRTLSFKVAIKNTGNNVWSSASVTVKIYGPDGKLAATPVLTISNVQPGVQKSYTVNWKVPSNAQKGVWRYEVYLNYGSILIGSSTGPANTFKVT